MPSWGHNRGAVDLSYFPMPSRLSSAQVKYNRGMSLKALGLLCGKVQEIIISFPEGLGEFVPVYSKILPRDVWQKTYPIGKKPT